ncbi:MAG: sigma-54-dependent Fis family transcriptional regulator [Sedimentibacter sp.]
MLTENDFPFLSVQNYDSTLKKIELAWEHFIAGEIITDFNLPRYPVFESWKRSMQMGVPHNLKKAPLKLDGLGVMAEKERHHDLFNIIDPYLDNIFKIFHNENMAVTFSNEKGIILAIKSGIIMQKKCNSDNYVVGASWNENDCGTNGIGTSLHTCKAIQIFATEHYCKIAHTINCSSALIKEPYSEIVLGVLTLTTHKDIVPAHTLNWTISEAQKIEKAIQYRFQEESMSLLNCLFEMNEQPCIICKTDGEISKINKSAQIMFDVKVGEKIDSNFENFPKYFLSHELYDAPCKVVCYKTEQSYIATIIPWSIGNYVIGAIVYFQKENLLPNQLSIAKMSDICSNFNCIIGKNASLRQVINLADKFSDSDMPILITGETGTGKEVLARAIHSNSNRKERPFLPVNCGAIPKELISSELFGYVEGAFTGTQKGGRIGKIEASSGGTLFLDEICEMPIDMQVYLLRVLEEGTITRVGSNKAIPINLRIICATNKDIWNEVEAGHFRKDLYYRLNTIELQLPPLRCRRDDIILLAEYFLKQKSNDFKLSTDAMEVLMGYSWPGNIRELKSVINRAVLLSKKSIITSSELFIPYKKLEPIHYIFDIETKINEKQLTPDKIRQAIKECGGNKSLAARRLDVSRMTLYRKIKKYGL